MSNTALVPVEEQAAFTNRQLDLIKTTIAPGVDDDQLALFVEVAKRTGLDPFSRQIYAILRKGKRQQDAQGNWHDTQVMTIQTGIDGYRAIAARTGSLAGIDDAVYDREDAPQPTKATVTVWRFVQGQRVPFTATARWGEYAVYKDEYTDGKKTGKKVLSDMWDRMPYLMLGKCAEALALRKAFPNEISGVYTTEEMAQADSDIPTGPSGPTRADLDDYAQEHGISDYLVKGGLKKYGGDIRQTLDAMKTFVQNRDAKKPKSKQPVTVEAAPAADGDDDTFTVEGDETPASLEALPVGTRGV